MGLNSIVNVFIIAKAVRWSWGVMAPKKSCSWHGAQRGLQKSGAVVVRRKVPRNVVQSEWVGARGRKGRAIVSCGLQIARSPKKFDALPSLCFLLPVSLSLFYIGAYIMSSVQYIV